MVELVEVENRNFRYRLKPLDQKRWRIRTAMAFSAKILERRDEIDQTWQAILIKDL